MESKKQGRISIIMPVYNGVSWIGECIESIRQQTDTNWELLVLDDHSTDGTTELVFKLAEEDSRILPILRQKNGVSAARNEGLEKAQGEFIMFVDADDKLDPQMLSVLRAMLRQTESDLAVCDYYRWNGKPDGIYNRSEELLKTDVEREENAARAKKVLPVDGAEKTVAENVSQQGTVPAEGVRVYNRSEYVSDYLLRGNTRCWSVLYRRSAIGQIRFREDLSIGEDMMFLMDLLMQISRVSITEYRGYFYRINEQGACPVLNGKNTRRKSHSAAVLFRKDLQFPGQKKSCRRAIGSKQCCSPPVRRCILRCIIIGKIEIRTGCRGIELLLDDAKAE